MNRKLPKLEGIAKQMIKHGAQLLKVSEELSESCYPLVTTDCDRKTPGIGTDRNAEFRSAGAVRIGDGKLPFDKGFDLFRLSTLGSVPLYVPEEATVPEAGYNAASFECGLDALRNTSAGGSE